MTIIPGKAVHFATCDLYDEFGEQARIIGSDLIDFGGKREFMGAAATIKCFEDNSLVREAVRTAGAGRVLVIDGGGSRRCALVGDMLAKTAVANGWSGLIIDGCVRDFVELSRLKIGIKARGTTPRKSNKNGKGQGGREVSIAGVAIRPDDMIFADSDGIVAIPDQAWVNWLSARSTWPGKPLPQLDADVE